MRIGELSEILGQIERLCLSAGSRGAAKDFKMLRDSLKPHSDKSVESFVLDLKGGFAAPKMPSRKNAAAKERIFNESAIKHHVERLRNAGTDEGALEHALVQIKNDRSVKLPEIAEIARQYSGTVTKYKSAASAREDITRAFVRQARFENKLR